MREFCTLHTGGLTEVVHTLPMLRCLRREEPTAVTYLADPRLTPLLEYAVDVDAVIPIRLPGSPISCLVQGWRFRSRWTACLNLVPCWRSWLVGVGSGARKIRSLPKPDPNSQHAWQDYANVHFPPSQIPQLDLTQESPFLVIPRVLQDRLMQALGDRLMSLHSGVGRLIALMPTAAGHGDWPLRHWISLLKLLNRRESGPWRVVLMGDENAARICECLEQEMAEVTGITIMNLCNRLTPLGMATVLSECELAIGCDSEPTHLAGALAVPVAVLFAQTANPKRAPYVGVGLSASPFQCPRECSVGSCQRRVLNCMDSLLPEQVWLAMKEGNVLS